MKTKLKCIVLLGTILFSLMSWADVNVFDRPFYLVKKQSRTQELIDQVVEDIFNSPLKETLCGTYRDSFSLSFAMGVTSATAKRIYESCPKVNFSKTPLIKGFQKIYYINVDEKNSLAIDSWTTNSNKTFLFLTKNSSLEELKQMLVHEMAISMDGKSSLNVFRYKGLENISSETQIDGNLEDALSFSMYKSVAYSFAAMRAFNVEKLVDGIKTSDDHASCTDKFLKILNLFDKQYSTYNFDNRLTDIIDVALDSSYDASVTDRPRNFNSQLKKILSEKLVAGKERKQTFCQYMATPFFSTNYNSVFHASGPRPRIGGGTIVSPTDTHTNLFDQINSDIEDRKLIGQ
jgi:hypothetical protein